MTERETDRQTDRQTETDRQTQTDRHRQTDRQTDRQLLFSGFWKNHRNLLEKTVRDSSFSDDPCVVDEE